MTGPRNWGKGSIGHPVRRYQNSVSCTHRSYFYKGFTVLGLATTHQHVDGYPVPNHRADSIATAPHHSPLRYVGLFPGGGYNHTSVDCQIFTLTVKSSH